MLGVQHGYAGSVVALLFSIWLYFIYHTNTRLTWILIALCFIFSLWGSVLPDAIDPPGNPYHRSIGHNFVSFFVFIFIFLISLIIAIIFQNGFFVIASAFFLSVISHFVLDMTTPMGLPMFVGKSILGLIEIPLFLIPVINVIMLVITIVSAAVSVWYLAKKIGGKLALVLIFIPIWAILLLLGIVLMPYAWWNILGYFLIIIGIILIALLLIIGHLIDILIQKNITKKINFKTLRGVFNGRV